jgi:hypothetical protein
VLRETQQEAFWCSIPCRSEVDTEVSERPAASNFRTEVTRVQRGFEPNVDAITSTVNTGVARYFANVGVTTLSVKTQATTACTLSTVRARKPRTYSYLCLE